MMARDGSCEGVNVRIDVMRYRSWHISNYLALFDMLASLKCKIQWLFQTVREIRSLTHRA